MSNNNCMHERRKHTRGELQDSNMPKRKEVCQPGEQHKGEKARSSQEKGRKVSERRGKVYERGGEMSERRCKEHIKQEEHICEKEQA